jgi:hypothetical protein
MKRYFLNVFALAVIAAGAASSAFGTGAIQMRVMNTCSGGGGTCSCTGACNADSTGCVCGSH